MRSEVTIRVRAGRAAVRAALLRVPAVALSGSGPALGLMGRIGAAALARIRAAFLVKSAGGTDEAGDSWPPVTPATAAYGRGRESSEGRRPSAALTPAQNTRWWQVYRQQLARFRGDRGRAAAFAWTILKREGAVTLIARYGGRGADILKNTGELLASLTPNSQSPHAVFRTYPGEVVLGTSRAGAAAHHEGVPGRLPRRRLWPEPRRWPAAWRSDINQQALEGLLDIAIFLARGAT